MLKGPHYMGDEASFEYQWTHWAWQKKGGCRIISLVRGNVLWDATTMNKAFSKFLLDVAEASYPVLMSISVSMNHWPPHSGKVQMQENCLWAAGWFSSVPVSGAATRLPVGLTQLWWKTSASLKGWAPSSSSYPHGHLYHLVHHCFTKKPLGWQGKETDWY